MIIRRGAIFVACGEVVEPSCTRLVMIPQAQELSSFRSAAHCRNHFPQSVTLGQRQSSRASRNEDLLDPLSKGQHVDSELYENVIGARATEGESTEREVDYRRRFGV